MVNSLFSPEEIHDLLRGLERFVCPNHNVSDDATALGKAEAGCGCVRGRSRSPFMEDRYLLQVVSDECETWSSKQLRILKQEVGFFAVMAFSLCFPLRFSVYCVVILFRRRFSAGLTLNSSITSWGISARSRDLLTIENQQLLTKSAITSTQSSTQSSTHQHINTSTQSSTHQHIN
jgi:hypothetical protein